MIVVDCAGVTQEVRGEELLIFISGCDHEPPLGFQQKGHLRFNNDPQAKFATSSTCDLTLIVPIALDYLEFKQMMVNSLLLYSGFGMT